MQMQRRRSSLPGSAGCRITGLLVASLIVAAAAIAEARAAEPTAGVPITTTTGANKDDDYDRLDGMGASRKTVHVIEWEDNLEVHVYPAGGLQGLGMVIDRTQKERPVMVIAYRFDRGKTLIRRAVLGIPIREGFAAYRDPSTKGEYDKVIVSNQKLQLPLFKLDPAPKQLYPDGHPNLGQPPEAPAAPKSLAYSADEALPTLLPAPVSPGRRPAEKPRPAVEANPPTETPSLAPASSAGPAKPNPPRTVDDDGAIRPFAW